MPEWLKGPDCKSGKRKHIVGSTPTVASKFRSSSRIYRTSDKNCSLADSNKICITPRASSSKTVSLYTVCANVVPLLKRTQTSCKEFQGGASR